MKRRLLMAWNGIGLVAAITMFTGIAALGQQQNKLAQAQQENARALHQYNWKSRTDIRKGGETKSPKLSLTRYAVDGSLQQTLISESSQSIPKFGLRDSLMSVCWRL